jgi:transcriptional regulator with XRE-family HTH domain
LHKTMAMQSQCDEGGDVVRLLATLKRCFKESGLTYKDVARSLSISEASVKRYFAGGTVALTQLERMCEIVRISVSDLVELAGTGSNQRTKELSLQQEEGLARSALTTFVFYLIRLGWRAAEIRDELEMNEAEITTCLIRLEKLHLIDLLPANRVKLLTAKFPTWLDGGPIRRQFDRTLKSEFTTLNYHAEGVSWELETLRLSQSSQARLQELVDDFMRAVRGMAEADRKLPKAQSEWRSMLVVSKPAYPKLLRRARQHSKRP